MEGSVARHTKYSERIAKKDPNPILGWIIGGVIGVQLLIIIFLLLIL